jgi:ketol-acid reductoisomerase
MRPLYNKHMDDIIAGEFSRVMMEDWAKDDIDLLTLGVKPPMKPTFEKASCGQ